MKFTKPMFSPRESPKTKPDFFQKLQYPLWLSSKLDGIRSVVRYEVAKSRALIDIPSAQVQFDFTKVHGFDGELICGSPTEPGVLNRTQSVVTSFNKTAPLSYYVFDYCEDSWLDKPFYKRYEELVRIFGDRNLPNHYLMPQVEVENEEGLLAYEEEQLLLGYEGIMMKSPVGHYKCGRGTFNQGLIYKLKRFEDAEGLLLSVKERMTNNNTLTTSEIGYAKRSGHQENKTPTGMAGGFTVDYMGQDIDVAAGEFTHPQLIDIWNHRTDYIGRRVMKFRFMKYGMKDKPRFGRAIGWRDKWDL